VGPALQFPATPHLSVVSTVSNNGDNLNIAVINKSFKEEVFASVSVKNFSFSPEAGCWILNGSQLLSTNENKLTDITVELRHLDVSLENNIFEMRFEPHSITVLELNRQI